MRPSQNPKLQFIGPVLLVVLLAAVIVEAVVFLFPRHDTSITEGHATTSALLQGAAGNPDVDPGTQINLPAPDFTLRDQQGKPVSLTQFRGKVVVLAFIDSHCTTICPLTTQSMLDALHLLGPAAAKVQLVGIDANPEATKVADVAAYTDAHHMQGRWEFLTGSLPQLKHVWREYHVYVAAVGNDIDHQPVFYLIGEHGRERAVYVTQMRYAGVTQQAQIVADGIARLLPDNPAVTQKVSLHFVPPLKPEDEDTVRASNLDAQPVTLGPGHPHLILFFAGWLDEDTQLSSKLTAIGHYAVLARRHHWPSAVIVNEVTTESRGAVTDAALTHLRASAHVPVIEDSTGRLADGYGVLDLPWFVLTSKSGRIIWQHDGWLTQAALTRDTTAALAGIHKT